MSKMGEALEKRLDENKYRMWEALKAIKIMLYGLGFEDIRQAEIAQQALNKVNPILARIEGEQ